MQIISLQTKWALLEPSCLLSGCISPHSFGIVRGEPSKYPVGWCPANYDGCFATENPVWCWASLWNHTAWPSYQQRRKMEIGASLACQKQQRGPPNTRGILDLAAMANWILNIFAFVCTLLIRHAGGWLADVLSSGSGLTTCHNGRRCISAKVVL